MKPLVRANDEVGALFLRAYNEVCLKAEEDERKWIADLRATGVKAAHPDDGWVDRIRNHVVLAYPQFNDGLEVGDLLALGYHYGDTRIVEVSGFMENRFANDKRFYVQFRRKP